MAQWTVGREHEWDGEDRKLVVLDGREIVVLRVDGEFHAFENRCLHMGGPVGEGALLGQVEAVLDDGRRVLGERFSDTRIQIVCPWHGWAYDVRTGACAGDARRRLPTFPTSVHDGHVYVEL